MYMVFGIGGFLLVYCGNKYFKVSVRYYLRLDRRKFEMFIMFYFRG